MRWFKHFTDNYRGRTVQRLLDEVGHGGVMAYYFIIEICAEKLEKTKEKTLTEVDCIFVFNKKVIKNVVRMKQKSIDNVARIGTECGVWEWKSNENEIEIKMPIILDLLDRDLKGTRSRRAQDAKKPRSDIDVESELDIDVELRQQEIANINSYLDQTLGAQVGEVQRYSEEILKLHKNSDNFKLWLEGILNFNQKASKENPDRLRYISVAILRSIGVIKETYVRA